MTTSSQPRLVAALLRAVAGLLLWGGACLPAYSQAPPSQAASCAAPKEWFNGKPVPLPDPAAFPASAGNCEFHLWSWQTFLWLMEPDNRSGQLRFETFASPDTLAPDTAPDITPGALLPGLNLRGLRAFGGSQAGPDGVLVDRNGRIAYYSIHINDVFRHFVAENALDTVEGILALDPGKPLPVGTLALKAAWKIMDPGDNPAAFYSRKAIVNPLIMKDGRLVVDPSRTEEVKVALVGLHIAGSVAHHPEMIWATFEHKDNAPEFEELAAPGLEVLRQDAPVSARSWNFHKAGTPYRLCNRDPATSPVHTLDEVTQKVAPSTEVCRIRRPAESPDRQENASNLASLNASVQLQIPGIWKNYLEIGASWIDTQPPRGGGPLRPGCDLRSEAEAVAGAGAGVGVSVGVGRCGLVLGGSANLANSVIETFNQSGEPATAGCLGCHNTLARRSADPSQVPLPAKIANLSHVLSTLYFRLQQK